MGLVRRILRPLVPLVIHYLLSELIIGMINFYLTRKGIAGRAFSSRIRLFAYVPLTLLAAWIFTGMYRQDVILRRRRSAVLRERTRLRPWEGILLVLVGAGLCLHLNQLMEVVIWILGPDAYQQQVEALMSGHSLLTVMLVAGVMTPLMEEMMFRWLVFLRLQDEQLPAILISAVLFGIYHGNPMQGTYAAILGIGMAWFMKSSGSLWSSYLIHMGANLFALVWPQAVELFWENLHGRYIAVIIPVEVLLALCVVIGVVYFAGQMKKRGARAL